MPDNRRYDQYGFPIPPGFDNDGQSESASLLPRSIALRLGIFLILVLIPVAVVFGPRLLDAGKQAVAKRYQEQAHEQLLMGNVAGALEDVELALSWAPEDPETLHLRGQCKLEQNDLAGSLEDLNRALESAPNRIETYQLRSAVHQRLGRHREAIDDATRVLELNPDPLHSALNNRAYARAIANMELEDGLADIERAIEMAGNEPAYLDTRGYLFYLLGRYEEALADLEEAVQAAELQKTRQQSDFRWERLPEELQQVFLKQHNEGLAVMYHHRGLTHQKLGNHDQGAADLKLSFELGYDPENGVY